MSSAPCQCGDLQGNCHADRWDTNTRASSEGQLGTANLKDLHARVAMTSHTMARPDERSCTVEGASGDLGAAPRA
jgi:hypothetical protein